MAKMIELDAFDSASTNIQPLIRYETFILTVF